MPVLQFNNRKRSDSADAVQSFESATAEIVAQHHPFTKRSVLYVLAGLIVLIAVFISVFHIDRVVNTSGRLVPIEGTLTVQPLDKAIITSILVAVGDTVKKGQVLATLDPTFVQADLGELEQKIASLEPQRRRMESEESGQPFHADPSKPFDLLQESIWKQRATEFQAGVLDFDQRIRSAEAQVVGLRRNIAEYQARYKIAVETEHIYIQLENEKLVSHLQLIAVQDQKLELERMLTEAEDMLASTEESLESLKQQKKVFVDKWHDDNLNNLVSTKNDLEAARGDFIKAKKMTELASLVSPADAIVLTIPGLTRGGVATDAQPLFSLIPINAPYEVDAQIDAQDSGFVKVGDPVRIKFDAYKFLEHGVAEGVVKTISQDSFTEQTNQDVVTQGALNTPRTPYFDARITITAVKFHDVPANTRLIPGMTLQADILVGHRTILWYLLGGALRSGAEAMREP
jgi:hemolysin D